MLQQKTHRTPISRLARPRSLRLCHCRPMYIYSLVRLHTLLATFGRFLAGFLAT